MAHERRIRDDAAVTEPPSKSRKRPRTTTIPAWIGTAEHMRWLGGIVKAILVMNVLDAFMTLVWVYSGRAVEANLFIADLVHNYPRAFVAVKLTLVAFGSFVLWRLRKRPLAVVSIFAAFLAYYFLVIYHLNALNLRLVQRLFD